MTSLLARYSTARIIYARQWMAWIPIGIRTFDFDARRGLAGPDWRVLYYTRRTLDKEALDLMEDVMDTADATGRNRHALSIDQDCGLDVWDALKFERNCPGPAFSIRTATHLKTYRRRR